MDGENKTSVTCSGTREGQEQQHRTLLFLNKTCFSITKAAKLYKLRADAGSPPERLICITWLCLCVRNRIYLFWFWWKLLHEASCLIRSDTKSCWRVSMAGLERERRAPGVWHRQPKVVMDVLLWRRWAKLWVKGRSWSVPTAQRELKVWQPEQERAAEIVFSLPHSSGMELVPEHWFFFLARAAVNLK